MGWAYCSRSTTARVLLAFLIDYIGAEVVLEELSIFIDESGDFGKFDEKCPYYITTLLFHEQCIDINTQVQKLNQELSSCVLGVHTVHSGPLIRRESIYKNYSVDERFKIFNKIFHFTRNLDIRYKNIVVEKKQIKTQIDISNNISKQLSAIIKENLKYFQKFDKIIIYYDNGQIQLANILVAVFSSWFGDNFEYRVVFPNEYKLFQSTDLLCTLSLLEHKLKNKKKLTNSENIFFGSPRKLKNNYLKKLSSKRF